MEALKLALKQLIIEALDLEDTRPEDIDDAAPLFGAGFDRCTGAWNRLAQEIRRSPGSQRQRERQAFPFGR